MFTLEGIAFLQIADARDRLVKVAGQIQLHDTWSAAEELSAIIRQLEAARRHLA